MFSHIKLKRNESIIMVTLEPNEQARSRYQRIHESLVPFGVKEFHATGSSIVVTAIVSDLASLAWILLSHLGEKDVVLIVSAQDERLVVYPVFQRQENDVKVKELGDFWKPSWID